MDNPQTHFAFDVPTKERFGNGKTLPSIISVKYLSHLNILLLLLRFLPRMFWDTCNQDSFWESHSAVTQAAAPASQSGLFLDCLSIERFGNQTERWCLFSLDYIICSLVSIFRGAGFFRCWDSCISIFYINRLRSRTVLTPSVVSLASPAGPSWEDNVLEGVS